MWLSFLSALSGLIPDLSCREGGVLKSMEGDRASKSKLKLPGDVTDPTFRVPRKTGSQSLYSVK